MVPVAVSCTLNFQKRDTRVFNLNSSRVVPLILVPGNFPVTSAGINCILQHSGQEMRLDLFCAWGK